VASRDVVLLDRHWGSLAVLPPASADDAAVACSYGAEALGLALLRSASGSDLDVRRRQLLQDLAERRWRVPGELVTRARVLGLPFPAAGPYVALLATDLGTVDGDAVAAAVSRELAPGTSLVADVGGDVLAVVHTSGPHAVAVSVLRAVDSVGASGGRVVVGTVVSRLEEVDGSIRRARAARELAADDGRITLAAELTPQLLLSGIREDPLAVELVAEQLGPLVDHDRAMGSDLVQTLRVYLTCSSSKVATAQALRLRRQTLYGRLQRIEQLIGSVSAPRRHTALVLALALQELAGRGAHPAPGIGAAVRRTAGPSVRRQRA
jgi:purine catabolism regulator